MGVRKTEESSMISRFLTWPCERMNWPSNEERAYLKRKLRRYVVFCFGKSPV
jgi:hypothetical protein